MCLLDLRRVEYLHKGFDAHTKALCDPLIVHDASRHALPLPSNQPVLGSSFLRGEAAQIGDSAPFQPGRKSRVYTKRSSAAHSVSPIARIASLFVIPFSRA